MWVKNKKTKTLQEIHNSDVLALCKKDTKNFEVSENRPENSSEKQVVEEENKETESEGEVPDSEVNTDKQSEMIDYSVMGLNELKKAAKEKGIQGYSNMDKSTLIAVIQAH